MTACTGFAVDDGRSVVVILQHYCEHGLVLPAVGLSAPNAC